MNVSQYLTKAQKRNPSANTEILEKSFLYSQKVHDGQKRASGDEYFTHPLTVSMILMDMGLDSETVAAALLHDTIEDTDTTKEDIKRNFNKNIASLVDGVTKLGRVDFDKYSSSSGKEKGKNQDREIESLRKLFLATAEDIRVVFIKLADRLHNMRTLAYLPESDRKRIAKETLDIFVPLADRLGMGQIKAELEDLAFMYCMPEEFEEVKNKVAGRIEEGKKYLPKIKECLSNILTQNGVDAEIDGRVKHLYGVYKKLNKYSGDIDKIYDIMAVRIIVEDVDGCYKALGMVHARFKPLIYRIKDYIAVPKLNGYRSLHTTVFGLDGKITEIQIRTVWMHEEAEHGVAAHWKYSENKENIFAKGGTSVANIQEIKLVKDLKNVSSADGDFKNMTLDLFRDRIFVFSPAGDIFELPEGATPVDFAYAVHSGIADRCIGAKINGKIVPLDTKLKNRAIVEIVTSKSSFGPSRDWLYFVVTQKAKQGIRAFLRKKDRDHNITLGRELLDEELKILRKPKTEGTPKKNWKKFFEKSSQKTVEDALAGIGDGSLSVRQIINKIYPPEKTVKIVEEKKTIKKLLKEKKVEVGEAKGLKVSMAVCCSPESSDKITGYITRGRGVTVHKSDCKNILNSEKERHVAVKWEAGDLQPRKTGFSLLFHDRKGILKEVTSTIADMSINITGLETKPIKGGLIEVVVGTNISDIFEKRILKEKLKKIKGLEELKEY